MTLTLEQAQNMIGKKCTRGGVIGEVIAVSMKNGTIIVDVKYRSRNARYELADFIAQCTVKK